MCILFKRQALFKMHKFHFQNILFERKNLMYENKTRNCRKLAHTIYRTRTGRLWRIYYISQFYQLCRAICRVAQRRSRRTQKSDAFCFGRQYYYYQLSNGKPKCGNYFRLIDGYQSKSLLVFGQVSLFHSSYL